jgi:hypothetical protein
MKEWIVTAVIIQFNSAQSLLSRAAQTTNPQSECSVFLFFIGDAFTGFAAAVPPLCLQNSRNSGGSIHDDEDAHTCRKKNISGGDIALAIKSKPSPAFRLVSSCGGQMFQRRGLRITRDKSRWCFGRSVTRAIRKIASSNLIHKH